MAAQLGATSLDRLSLVILRSKALLLSLFLYDLLFFGNPLSELALIDFTRLPLLSLLDSLRLGGCFCMLAS